MPKKTDDEKAARTGAIQKALVAAMGPPLETLRSIRRTAEALKILAPIANKNLITDVGVAGLLLEAAAEGAALNVKINLAGMKDEARVDSVSEEVRETLLEIAQNCSEAMAEVEKALA